jgi:CheY-like chemotaxis protein
MTRVLVIDDDPQLVRALRINLAARRYEVHTAADGATALAVASKHPPEVVILDLGLPDLDGIAVIEGLRGWCRAPIIVLSARHSEAAKVDALDAGADDYITKPFGMDELLARLRAALRRATPPGEDTSIVVTDAFTIDLAAKTVTAHGGELRLTPTSGSCWRFSSATAANSSPRNSCSTTSGVPPTTPRPATCACTSRTCAANSNPTPANPVTSSPKQASATASRPERRSGRIERVKKAGLSVEIA